LLTLDLHTDESKAPPIMIDKSGQVTFAVRKKPQAGKRPRIIFNDYSEGFASSAKSQQLLQQSLARN
jgi:hypothetical protein